MPAASRLAPVLLVSAALLGGCGGGGGEGTTPTGGDGAQSGAYQGGFEICSGGTVGEIAELYGVPEATPEAVAEVIAEAVSGGMREDATDATQGCLDAFAQQE